MPRSWWQLSPWSSCDNSGGCWWSPWRKSCVDLGQDSRLLGQFIRWCIASFLTCLCEIQYVEMSYTPMPGDSNGNGWCQVKIVDEMFLFAWSWWSSDQHARINSNGRASASLDTTWLKTTEWWLLAYGHPAVAQTVIALQRIADTAWRISSLIPSSLWLTFILTSMSIIGRSNIQAHTRHEWSTFLQGIDTNCWTGSVQWQRRNGWAMLSHFKPMLAYVPSNWQGNGISTLRTENIFTLWDVFSLYFPLRSFCCIVGHCSILERVRQPFDRMIYCICVCIYYIYIYIFIYYKKTCIHILYIYIYTLVILKEARNHLKESTNRSCSAKDCGEMMVKGKRRFILVAGISRDWLLEIGPSL